MARCKDKRNNRLFQCTPHLEAAENPFFQVCNMARRFSFGGPGSLAIVFSIKMRFHGPMSHVRP